MVPYIISENRVTVFLKGKPIVVISKDLLAFDTFIEKIQQKDVTEENIEYYLDDYKRMILLGKDRIRIDENEVVFFLMDDGEEIILPSAISERYTEMIKKGFDIEPFEEFIKNIQRNPSKDIREELFLFLQAGDLPLTEDGCFLAYKGVNSDYYDTHSRTILNKIGERPSMEWSQVDSDRNATCSYGLHFAVFEYAKGWGERLMVLKINPKDVAAIPNDYHNQKGRCVQYEVIDEIQKESKEKIIPLFISEAEKNIEEKPLEKKNYEDFSSEEDVFSYLQFSCSLTKHFWKAGIYSYGGYLLKNNKAGEDWHDTLFLAKEYSPEISKALSFPYKNGIKSGAEIAMIDRVLVLVIERQGKQLSKPIMLLPKKDNFMKN